MEPGPRHVWNIISATWYSVLLVVGFFGNLLVIFTVAANSRLHLKRYLIPASLALSDLLVVVLVILFRAIAKWKEDWIFGMTWCQGSAFIVRSLYLVTTAHLCAVSYDRYKAIVEEPLLYCPQITQRTILLNVLFLWILPAAISTGSLVGLGEFQYNDETFVCDQGWEADNRVSAVATAVFGVGSFIVPLAVLIKLNHAVFKAANQQQQQQQQQSRAIRADQHQTGASEGEQTQQLRTFLIEYRAAIDVVIIIGVYMLCYLPPWIAGICRQVMDAGVVPVPAYLIVSGISASSAVWNPLIYSIRKREFRKAMLSVLTFQRNNISAMEMQ